MIIASAVQLVHKVTNIRKKNKTSGVLVKSSDRIDPVRITNIIDDIILFFFLGSANDSYRLIESNNNFRLVMFYLLAAENNTLTRQHPVTK